jgi:hypothetical protein
LSSMRTPGSSAVEIKTAKEEMISLMIKSIALSFR